jgi:hypothetical protein
MSSYGEWVSMRAVPPAFSNCFAAARPRPVGRRWKWLSKIAIRFPAIATGLRRAPHRTDLARASARENYT